MQLIIDSLPLLWRGLIVTFQLASLTLLFTAFISLFVGIASVSRFWTCLLYTSPSPRD